ncbi:tryptophan synthase subunit alpha [Blochmannia endosymbiont of Polyrhachis (Hedomyrma) turneri]|uniref:tryptophan synthase subunit alpha n=1 Tax=Blochmannia endosymbiont of Polyrhachis (Hedomyrma) turneri TaxID=1505596 RepID=UPI00061A6C1C|nr:tryptophan synthase subunit alpha [Blochmannia endosymbiont of Polyrhachis (Hedomyrma) turneri]AKC59992.1 Tryptophan synthase alpha chain [Blochmannia endosymbiont of Polyrhachis (Hedomyrma) turneri]
MTRYKKLFSKLMLQQEKAFIPFVTLGDPDFHLSIKIINILIKYGADALELGIPFSDPLGDGKSIQNSFQRALDSKIKINDAFKIIKIIRQKYSNIPIGLLTYTNLVFKNGIDEFYSSCQQHNIDSILIADLPIEESKIFRNAALQHNISQVFICPPNANNNLLKQIAKHSQSYTYLTSRPGVTGNEHNNSMHDNCSLDILIHDLKTHNSPPIIQGFGISCPLDVQIALSSEINGIISGSAIADIIMYNMYNHEILFDQLKNFVSSMKKATIIKK